MAYKYRGESLTSLDFTKWILVGSKLDDKYDLVLPPKTSAHYNGPPLSEDYKYLSTAYMCRVSYSKVLPQQRYEPTLNLRIKFEKDQHLQEPYVQYVAVNAHPNDTTTSYLIDEAFPIGMGCDNIVVYYHNASDETVTVKSVEVFASFDMSDNIENIVEAKMPVAKRAANTAAYVFSTPATVCQLDFSVSSGSVATGTACLQIHAPKPNMVDLALRLNGKPLSTMDMKQTYTTGYHVLTVPFFIEKTETGNNKLEAILSAESLLDLPDNALQLIIESRNMLGSSGGGGVGNIVAVESATLEYQNLFAYVDSSNIDFFDDYRQNPVSKTTLTILPEATSSSIIEFDY